MVMATTVIVGGGIIGVCTAYFLGQAGEDVIVVDRGELASGTSKQCNGSVASGTEKLSAYACRSNTLYARFAEESDLGFEYRRKGSFRLIGSEEKLHNVTAVLEKQRREGLVAQLISPEELKRQEPKIDTSHILAAVDYPMDADMNPYLAVRVIAGAAERLGVRILRRTEVSGIRRDPGKGSFSIITAKGKISARRIVNAAGVWAAAIGNMLGVRIPVVPLRGQVIVTESTEPLPDRKINEAASIQLSITDGNRPVRLKVTSVLEPTPHHTCLIGRSEELVGYENRTTTQVIRALCTRAASHVPAFTKVNIIRTYAGLRPVTPDGLPIISEIKEVPGLFVATGHGGNGITLGPITGLLLSEMILGRPPSLPVGLFDLHRFSRANAESE